MSSRTVQQTLVARHCRKRKDEQHAERATARAPPTWPAAANIKCLFGSDAEPIDAADPAGTMQILSGEADSGTMFARRDASRASRQEASRKRIAS